MRGNVGANLLARAIAQMGAREAEGGSPAVELGTVQPDLSIRVDGWSVAIPKGEYLLARSLTLPDPMVQTGPGGEYGHTHAVPRPAALAPLKPGDRVVCVWAGSDLVVLDVVVSS